MKAIYKYVVTDVPSVISGSNTDVIITVPKNSKILCCKIQHGKDICIWAEVDIEEKDVEKYRLGFVGTGWLMIEENLADYEYLDSILINDGMFVYHIYIKKGV